MIRPGSIDERGATLVATLLILSALFALTVAGLTAATSSLTVSGHYRHGVQALLAAETGVLHSAKTLDGIGVIRFDNEVVSAWSSLFGTAERAMPGHSAITYAVAAATDATNPLQRMTLTSTGRAPRGARRQVQAGLRLDGAFSPGAIFLPGNSVDTTFNGNAFLVDGNDYRLAGGLNPNGENRPGIGVLNPGNVGAVESSLSGVQLDNVLGLGGSPSVLPSNGPSSSRITDEIVPGILAQPGVVTNPTIHGADVFGTVASPQITHFTGNVTINGAATGAGILIVDQGLTISGNMSFVGLIIVRGTTEITSVLGNATVLGAIWTTDLQLTVAGSAGVFYSSEALQQVANLSFGGNVLPQGVALLSWREL